MFVKTTAAKATATGHEIRSSTSAASANTASSKAIRGRSGSLRSDLGAANLPHKAIATPGATTASKMASAPLATVAPQ